MYYALMPLRKEGTEPQSMMPTVQRMVTDEWQHFVSSNSLYMSGSSGILNYLEHFTAITKAWFLCLAEIMKFVQHFEWWTNNGWCPLRVKSNSSELSFELILEQQMCMSNHVMEFYGLWHTWDIENGNAPKHVSHLINRKRVRMLETQHVLAPLRTLLPILRDTKKIPRRFHTAEWKALNDTVARHTPVNPPRTGQHVTSTSTPRTRFDGNASARRTPSHNPYPQARQRMNNVSAQPYSNIGIGNSDNPAIEDSEGCDTFQHSTTTPMDYNNDDGRSDHEQRTAGSDSQLTDSIDPFESINQRLAALEITRQPTTQKAVFENQIVREKLPCDGLLLRGTCRNMDTCPYNHDAKALEKARSACISAWNRGGTPSSRLNNLDVVRENFPLNADGVSVGNGYTEQSWDEIYSHLNTTVAGTDSATSPSHYPN